MTFHEANRTGGPGLTTDNTPLEVRGAAEARGLGNLVDTRHGSSTRQTLVIGWGLAGACLLIDLALWPTVSNEDPFSASYGLMHAVYRAMIVGIVLGLGIGIRALVTGRQSYYLYAEGIVHARRSNCRALAWPDVVRVAAVHDRRTGSGAGKVLGYRVEAVGGGKISIPLNREARRGGRDPFIDRLLDSARSHNRPIA
ncbi:hypothetical protein [Actinospica sp.]|uniref:hypothetical protein n=1 Tax=Actinospica sp. TaxID=1872142 RepID=UPI002CFFEF5D|nr:hypothetical protein [Actinospica sp.]HWG24688.1 hypothetical protein [Actinospica sp.]